MTAAPKVWRGRFLEDFSPGDVFRSRLGRTISEADNTWFTCLTMNTNQVHFNAAFAERTRFGRMLVNCCLTLALVTGLSVPDTSENAHGEPRLDRHRAARAPSSSATRCGRSRRSSSTRRVEVAPEHRASSSLRTRGVNQRGEVVIEFKRTFMALLARRGRGRGDVPGGRTRPGAD